MSFLRHDVPTPTQDAVLFDREGNTHVKGRSTRVAQHPGGNSTFSFGWGSDPVEQPKAQVGRHRFQDPNEVSKPAPAPVAASPAPALAPLTNQAPAQQKQPEVYNALFCNEGSQVRTRPARKAMAPPGGQSSIVF